MEGVLFPIMDVEVAGQRPLIQEEATIIVDSTMFLILVWDGPIGEVGAAMHLFQHRCNHNGFTGSPWLKTHGGF